MLKLGAPIEYHVHMTEDEARWLERDWKEVPVPVVQVPDLRSPSGPASVPAVLLPSGTSTPAPVLVPSSVGTAVPPDRPNTYGDQGLTLADPGPVERDWQETLASAEAIAGLVVLSVACVGALVTWYLVWSGRLCRGRRLCAGAVPSSEEDGSAGAPPPRLCAPCRFLRACLAGLLSAVRLLWAGLLRLC